jgi:hypothetical protein
MKVIAWYRDGGKTEIEFQCSMSAKEAIEKAKKELGDDAADVKRWEVEEDFI